MPKKETIPYVQQQLLEAIAQLKDGKARDQVLSTLEAVCSQLQSLVTHDHLTGALNRRSLLESLEKELQRSKRTGHTFTVALIGISGLPEVMEQHGQEIPKQILQIVTKQANLALRELDSFGRVGATEFAIVMPTTWLDQSLVAVERLKAQILSYDWSQIAAGLQVTFCTGLTSNAPGDQAEKVLLRADLALQQARQAGDDSVRQVEADLPVG
ncbi:MAG: GGDEF domain-containing protein [Undibacterium sp.]|nr:GGDEF domain-containing protein [Undibacterium sp.]